MSGVVCARTGCGKLRMSACSPTCHLLSGNHAEEVRERDRAALDDYYGSGDLAVYDATDPIFTEPIAYDIEEY
ncbi:hypothetical protein SEA_OBLADI_108 [Gordonia phage ObLaDi]|uniref:Uncharacterized protein n=1 Tax=Gordonia phage ObLaDi TaxID=2978487 RepID=A0A977KLS4_9CAUD|nr:hypothetical protein SEA_OBLADI_108 [Gordonia phage ObLaDi]